MPSPDVYVNARTVVFPGGVAVPSVTVALYTSAGAFVTTATTDASGNAFLGNRAPATYEIRVTAPAPGAVINGTVQTIVVPSSSTDQYFDVLVDNSALPVATDALFCRCSGYFKDPYGTAIENLVITFSEDNTTPNLLYYSANDNTHAIIPTQLTVRTDVDGYVSVDLMRDQLYTVYIGSLENISRTIKVPDLTSSSLPDVIWQMTERVEYKDGITTQTPVAAPTITITVSEVKTLTIETVFRSGVREDGLVEITAASSDTAVATIAAGSTTMVLTGVTTGSATINLTRTAPETDQGLTAHTVPVLRGELVITVDP